MKHFEEFCKDLQVHVNAFVGNYSRKKEHGEDGYVQVQSEADWWAQFNASVPYFNTDDPVTEPEPGDPAETQTENNDPANPPAGAGSTPAPTPPAGASDGGKTTESSSFKPPVGGTPAPAGGQTPAATPGVPTTPAPGGASSDK